MIILFCRQIDCVIPISWCSIWHVCRVRLSCSWYLITLKHLAHAWRKIFVTAADLIKCFRQTRKKQIADYVRTYFWVTILYNCYEAARNSGDSSLQAWLSVDPEPPDIYIIGFQELDLRYGTLGKFFPLASCDDTAIYVYLGKQSSQITPYYASLCLSIFHK